MHIIELFKLKIIALKIIVSILIFCNLALSIKQMHNTKNQALAEKNSIAFLIIVPSYNTEKYTQSALESIRQQTYCNYQVICINDCSTDKTGILMQEFIDSHKLHAQFKIIHNKKRLGALENIYTTAMHCPKDKVIAILDGDDELFCSDALEYVAKIYLNKNIWITYGQYITTEGMLGCCQIIPQHIKYHNAFRRFPWVSSHLRTFRAALFHKIKRQDILYQNKPYPVVADLVSMLPMLEMASKEHIYFCKDKILYKYNTQNDLNDHKQNAKLITKLGNYFRRQKPYKPLSRLN